MSLIDVDEIASANFGDYQLRVWGRVGHGLDASMDWIGLGRMLEKLGWIGIHM